LDRWMTRVMRKKSITGYASRGSVRSWLDGMPHTPLKGRSDETRGLPVRHAFDS
jgi:hypothetical protein